MKQIELTSKLVLAIIGLTSVSAILVPTYAVPSIRSVDIVNETILSEDIKNGEVKTVDLASGAVKPNVHIVKESATVGPNTDENAFVDCPAGEILTGGGFSVASDVIVRGSHPEDENTWRVLVHNENVNFEAGFSAYALCIGPSP